MCSKEIQNWRTGYEVAEILSGLEFISVSKGFRIVMCLVKNPCKVLPFFYLEQVSSRENEFVWDVDINDAEVLKNASEYFYNTSIAMCDEQTRREVLKRLNLVISQIEDLSKNGNSKLLYDLEEEKEKLVDYLTEVLGKNGKIRTFRDNFKRVSESIQKRVSRFLKELRKYDKELAIYLKKTIQSTRAGLVFMENRNLEIEDWEVECLMEDDDLSFE